MISKNRIKQIHSLAERKFRKKEGLFVAEGPKLVGELLANFTPRYIAATEGWTGPVTDVVTEDELKKASLQQHPQQVIALFPIPQYEIDFCNTISSRLCLALDGVQDPGNMGTICRIADWFGIEDIFCSMETVDVYNPKAVQATMGSLSRVRVHYINLYDMISSLPKEVHVYGTFLDGENMYDKTLSQNGLIVMGNEGNGISPTLSSLINNRLFIPNYPDDRLTTESLNVGVATSIICAEFRRQAREVNG